MNFVLEGHDLEHAVQTVIQAFYQNESYKRLEASPDTGTIVISGLDGGVFYGKIYHEGKIVTSGEARPGGSDKRERTQAAAKAVFNALRLHTGYRPPWGTLTGVRPAKLITERLKAGRGADEAINYLREAYLVREDKLALCAEVARAEFKFLESSNADDIGIYVGIPFCPSICGYCSFGSFPIDKAGSVRETYLNALFKETEFLGTIVSGKKVTALYIGGGTPTSLSAGEIESLLYKIRKTFPGEYELTVEAGRPDSLDALKLRVLKEYGTTRLAVNPQTMSDKTLARIGRKHTASDFLRAYETASGMGFDNINCDIILGLPGETEHDAANTFTELAKLAPASITVHTLALKRAAEFNHTFGRYSTNPDASRAEESELEKMLSLSRWECDKMGLRPYYMYRQKNMAGNFENVGYAKEGYESVYNHMTMTEARNVWAAGAGAVTKVLYPEIKLIKRAFNVRRPDEYISRIDEMIERKRKLL